MSLFAFDVSKPARVVNPRDVAGLSFWLNATYSPSRQVRVAVDGSRLADNTPPGGGGTSSNTGSLENTPQTCYMPDPWGFNQYDCSTTDSDAYWSADD